MGDKSNKQMDNSSARGYQSQEVPLTMPQLKRMRQASMSIIRRTGRTQQNADRNFSAYNPGFQPNDDLESNDTANLETCESEENEETCSKTRSEDTWKIDNSPASSCTNKRPSLRKLGTIASPTDIESPQAMFQNKASNEIYQQRESIALKTKVILSISVKVRVQTETIMKMRASLKPTTQDSVYLGVPLLWEVWWRHLGAN